MKKEDRKKDLSGLLYHLADNIIGFDDGYETKGEKAGKTVNETVGAVVDDPVQALKSIVDAGKGLAEDISAGPVAYTNKDVTENPDGTVPLTSKQQEQMLGDVFGLAAGIGSPSIGAKFDPDKVSMFIGAKAKHTDTDAQDFPLPTSRGADGNTRYEIADNELVVDTSKIRLNKAINLIDVLDHPELYRQYPDLAEVKFMAQDLPADLRGFYLEPEGPSPAVITVNMDMLDNPLDLQDTLLHETQHHIQKIEGWEPGTNPSIVSGKEWELINSKDNLQKWNAYLLEMDTHLDKEGSIPKFLGAVKRNTDSESVKEEIDYFIRASRANPRSTEFLSVELFNEAGDEIKTFLKDPSLTLGELLNHLGLPVRPLLRDPRDLSPHYHSIPTSEHETYARNSGEVEARNTPYRQDLNMLDRWASPVEDSEDRLRSEQWFTPRNYSEGGLAVEKDPVSGNEVPAGATPEEVRDDIDANLSEGEYVIPANVVRYFGVSHFEKLVQKANKGFEEMQANGRIGGEPKQDPEPEDDLPLTDEELAAADGAPALQMNEGGLVPDVFDPSQYQMGFSTRSGGTPSQATGGQGIQNKIYRGPDGERRVIMFINGVPINQIPDGYVEDTPESRAATEEANKQMVDETIEKGGYSADDAASDAPATPDWAGMTPEGREATARAGQTFGGVIGGMLGLGPLGANLAASGQKSEMAAQGLSEDQMPDNVTGRTGMIDGLLDNLSRSNSSSKDVSFDPDTNSFSSDGISVSKGLMDAVNDAVSDPSAPAPAPAPSAPSGPSADGGDDGDDGDDGYGGAGNDYGNFRKGGLVMKTASKGKKTKKSSKKGLATRK